MGKFLLKRPRIISKKFPRVESHIDGVTKSLEGLVFSYSREVDKALQKKRLLMLLSSMVLVMVLGSFISPKGKADSAIFHPHSCLGGWINPGHAEGKPDTTSNTDEESFTEVNAAILPSNTKADMYCGNFVGEIEKNTKPTKILVSLSWTKGKDVLLEQKIESESFASSSGEILDAANTTEISFTLSSSTEVISGTTTEVVTPDQLASATTTDVATTSPSIIDQVVEVLQDIVGGIFDTETKSPPSENIEPVVEPAPKEETTQSITPTEQAPAEQAPAPAPSPEGAAPVSFLDFLVQKITAHIIYPVYAEEIVSTSTSADDSGVLSTSTEVTADTEKKEVSVETMDTPAASSSDAMNLTLSTSTSTEEVASSTGEGVIISALSTSTDATTTEATSTEPITPPVVVDPESDDMATNNFLEILYTFDGVTWNSLGKVNEISMKYRTFEIPVSATTSWNDMAQLQIKIERLSQMDETPTVYLDGMQVEVLYETPVIHEHPDFARDTILKDKSDDGVRVISIINSDTNTNEIWYTTIDVQGEYGVAPGTWVEVNLAQASSLYKLVDIYGRNIFWVDEIGKMLWVTNLQKETNDGIGLVLGATTTVSFSKINGEEWFFEYNEKTKTGVARIKQ